MDISDQIVSIVSRFPSGICGVDLRFALQVSIREFEPHIEKLLVDQALQVDTPNDYDYGRFRLNSNLLISEVKYNTVSKTVYDIHTTLQKYPRGLTVKELSNRTGHPEDNIADCLRQNIALCFIKDITDDAFHSKYKTCLSEDLLRLVNTRKTVAHTQPQNQRIWWLSIAGGLLILLSQWLF